MPQEILYNAWYKVITNIRHVSKTAYYVSFFANCQQRSPHRSYWSSFFCQGLPAPINSGHKQMTQQHGVMLLP